MEFIAEARELSDLNAVARARAEQLQVTRLSINDAAGLADGYASKLLAADPAKYLGRVSFGPTLRALGLRVFVVADPDALEQVKNLLVRAVGAQRRVKGGVADVNIAPAVLSFLKAEFGRASARAMNAAMTPAQRSQNARQAAQARWAKRA